MELKEGMYVRTNCHREIVVRKIVKIVEDTFIHDYYLIFDKPTKYTYYVEDNNFIVKENPIDLIEIGDYVNGYLVTGFDYQYSSNKKVVFSNVRLDGTGIKIPAKDIKSIVTKEQFVSVKYEVE